MDRGELEAELEREHPDAFGWALRCARGVREDAEDALHAAYERILDGRARFDGRSSFRTWLFGVVRRTAQEQRRRAWLRVTRLHDWFTRSGGVASEERGDAVVEGEARTQLQAALGQLSGRQRDMLHLVFYQELSVQEAATLLGIPVGTARTHYERGKARLRGLLGADDA